MVHADGSKVKLRVGLRHSFAWYPTLHMIMSMLYVGVLYAHFHHVPYMQWNLQIKDTLGEGLLFSFRRLSWPLVHEDPGIKKEVACFCVLKEYNFNPYHNIIAI